MKFFFKYFIAIVTLTAFSMDARGCPWCSGGGDDFSKREVPLPSEGWESDRDSRFKIQVDSYIDGVKYEGFSYGKRIEHEMIFGRYICKAFLDEGIFTADKVIFSCRSPDFSFEKKFSCKPKEINNPPQKIKDPMGIDLMAVSVVCKGS